MERERPAQDVEDAKQQGGAEEQGGPEGPGADPPQEGVEVAQLVGKRACGGLAPSPSPDLRLIAEPGL